MILWLLVVVPFAAAIVAYVLPPVARGVAAAGLGLTAGVGGWAAATQADAVVSWGPRLELTLGATGFARMMVVLVPLIALPVVLYAAATERGSRVRLIALLTAFIGAMELVVVATDLVTLLIGWELVGAFSWLLIAHERQDATKALKASHAFITTRAGDLGLYIAAGIAFASTGSFAFARISDATPAGLQVIAGGVLVAAAAKSAQVPFSPWLFSAMAGPTPVSALLHSSTMVAAGAYLLLRLAPHLDGVPWFAPAVIALGLASALSGGIVASIHNDPKRLLAASTTAQYGLMFVAIGAGARLAAGTHLVAHAAFKALLFLSAGAATTEAGSSDLRYMRLGRRLPLLAVFAGVGALALAGVPPLGAAWSKEQITAVASERSEVLGAALLLAAFLSAFYAFRYWALAFGPDDKGGTPSHRASTVAATIGSLAVASVALGVLWFPSANEAAARVVGGDVGHAAVADAILGLATISAAAAVLLFLRARSLLASGFLPSGVAVPVTEWFGISAATRWAIVNPLLASSRTLAGFDDRVVDGGIRVTVRTAGWFSGLLKRRSELSLDAVVNGVGGGTLALAAGARATDDHGVDAAAEGVAESVGRAGTLLRRLQTGLSHHYYVIVAGGLVVLVLALATGTS